MCKHDNDVVHPIYAPSSPLHQAHLLLQLPLSRACAHAIAADAAERP